MKTHIIVPKDSWEALETLARKNPAMLVSEVLEEYDHGKLCYKAWLSEQDKEANALAESLMKDKYFKIHHRGGMDITYYIEVLKASVEGREVYCDLILSKLILSEGVTTLETKICTSFKQWQGFAGEGGVEVLTEEQYEAFHVAVSALFNIGNE